MVDPYRPGDRLIQTTDELSVNCFAYRILVCLMTGTTFDLTITVFSNDDNILFLTHKALLHRQMVAKHAPLDRLDGYASKSPAKRLYQRH